MLEIRDLQIKYGDFIAMDEVNLDIHEGEFFTLLGPSGCGKTTTLRAIAGFNTPSKGTIKINGEDIVDVPVEKRGLGMVFQSYALFPTMTVYDNIAYGLEVEGRSKEAIDQTVRRMAKMVDLTDEQLEKNVSDLSGGQQQRVAIARAMAKGPKYVLFDEPLSNLDARLRKQLRRELKKIQREAGLTAIYVTHDQEEALELSDQIAVFNNGYIEQVGTPKEIYDQSATEFVCNFIGDANQLGDLLAKEIASQTSFKYQANHNYYIREEKILLEEPSLHSGELAVIDALVLDESFKGSVFTLTLDALGTKLKVLSQNDGKRYYPLGSEVKIYIDIDSILGYEVN
ncbi:ABC transporter ATP-binding protein [Hutsoniella sourekii]